MTDTIEVYRGDGLRRGSCVVDALLSDGVLIDRGLAEMNSNAHQFNKVTLDIVFNPDIRLGQLVEVSDPSSSLMYKGKVVSIGLKVSAADIVMSLGLERPR